MRHVEHGLAVACLALVLGCGANGQTPAPPPQQPQTPTRPEDQELLNQFVAPHERVAKPTIELADVNGACEKPEGVTPEYTAKGRMVQWRILNGCSREQTIRLTNWRIKGTEETDYPFRQPETQAACKIEPGRFCVITLTVRPTGPRDETGAWVYRYDIVNGDGTVLDPEIIIEWF